MLDFVNTNTFRDFADFVIMPHSNRPFVPNILKQNAVIYCKTDYIQYLFSNLAFSNRKYVLITHASDYPIDEVKFKSRPNSIKKWYAENAVYAHPDLITIPVGLTPTKDVDKTGIDIDWFAENIKRLKANQKDTKILYCRWSTQNNPPKRANVVEKLRNNGLECLWEYPTFPSNIDELLQEQLRLVKEGGATYQKFNELITWYDYCERMSQYKFVVSPPGNGEDTHRVWDALYMGCFPIVIKSNVFNDYKNDLPIIQVKDYSEVTYDLLHSYLNREYNYEKLTMEYWKNRITEELKKL
jgi:hypothetical protein